MDDNMEFDMSVLIQLPLWEGSNVKRIFFKLVLEIKYLGELYPESMPTQTCVASPTSFIELFTSVVSSQ